MLNRQTDVSKKNLKIFNILFFIKNARFDSKATIVANTGYDFTKKLYFRISFRSSSIVHRINKSFLRQLFCSSDTKSKTLYFIVELSAREPCK